MVYEYYDMYNRRVIESDNGKVKTLNYIDRMGMVVTETIDKDTNKIRFTNSRYNIPGCEGILEPKSNLPIKKATKY